MLDMINEENNNDVIGHGEGTAKPVVKMENTLKEAAEPSHSEEVYIAEQKSNLGAGAGNFAMSSPVTTGGLGTSSRKVTLLQHPNGFRVTSRDTCDFLALMCCMAFPGILIFRLDICLANCI